MRLLYDARRCAPDDGSSPSGGLSLAPGFGLVSPWSCVVDLDCPAWRAKEGLVLGVSEGHDGVANDGSRLYAFPTEWVPTVETV